MKYYLSKTHSWQQDDMYVVSTIPVARFQHFRILLTQCQESETVGANDYRNIKKKCKWLLENVIVVVFFTSWLHF